MGSARRHPRRVEVPPWPDDTRGAADQSAPRASDRRILPAFLLAFFVGVFGVHRFYVGKTGTGITMLILTLTLFGLIATAIWATIDWILIVCGAFPRCRGSPADAVGLTPAPAPRAGHQAGRGCAPMLSA